MQHLDPGVGRNSARVRECAGRMGNNVSMSKGWNQGSNAVHLENGFGAFEVFKKPGKLFGSNYFVVWMPHRLYVKLGSEAQADTFVRTVVRPILCDGSISTFLSPQNIDQILELTEYTNAQQVLAKFTFIQ